jgi:hypothetical protein
MPDLIVPVPDLKYKALAPGVAPQEQPVEVRLGPVQSADGSPFTPFTVRDLVSPGFLIYRQSGPGASLEVWDVDREAWQPESTTRLDDLKVQAMAFKEGDPLPWQGLLVALGYKDGTGKDLFERQTSGFPRYSFRARFVGKFGEEQVKGLSPLSAFVGFASITDQNRAGFAIQPDGQPKDATQMRLFLRNAALQRIGSVEIRTDGGSAVIEITNFTAGETPLARVSLLATGEIRLSPANTQKVVIEGDLETNRIRYLPSVGVGNKVDL